MLGLLEIDYGFCAACCTKLTCCLGLIDAWSEVIFFAGTSATNLVIVCREAWCQASLQQAGVCVMCANTSRLRHKVCTHVEDPCVWVLRVGVALESKVDAACVRTTKEEAPTGMECSPTSSERAPGREKTSGMWGSTQVGLGELRQIWQSKVGARFHANDEVGDEVLGDPGSLRTGPVAASPFGSPR